MKKQKATKVKTIVKTVYVRDPQEYSPPSTREPLPPHVELTSAAIRAWYNRDKT